MDSKTTMKINILKKFKKGLVSFIDELISQFPMEGDLISLRVFIADQAPIEDIIEKLRKKLLPHKTMIIKREEEFFLQDKANIFDELNADEKVSHFKELWQSDDLDQEDKDALWKWFEYHLTVIEEYEKLK